MLDGMTVVLYLWLLGVVLVGFGGALAARGWWLDKAAGNYRRARCRKCWYVLEGIAARADGVTVCPECGVEAKKPRDLHRVRRQWMVVVAGVVMLGVGVYLCGRPVLDGGRWLYLLPRSVAARLWVWAGAENYGRDIRTRMAQGTATEAEIESVTGGARALVLKAAKGVGMGGMVAGVPPADIAAAFTALGRQPRDEEVERAAGVLMVENMPYLSQPATRYLVGMGVPMERRIEMGDAALAAKKGMVFPQEYLKMLSEADDSPVAMAALVRMAAGPRNAQLTSWARNSLINAEKGGLTGVMTAFREAKTVPDRAKLFELFGQLAPYRDSGDELVPFVLEVLAVPELRVKAREYLLQNDGRIEYTDEQIREWVKSDDQARVDLALELVGRRNRLPEGCGATVLKMIDAGKTVPRQVMFRFTGEDRWLWVARLNGGTPASRREACAVVASYGSRVPGSVEALQKIEGDAAESEEMRVAARDALRQLGVWRRE